VASESVGGEAAHIGDFRVTEPAELSSDGERPRVDWEDYLLHQRRRCVKIGCVLAASQVSEYEATLLVPI